MSLRARTTAWRTSRWVHACLWLWLWDGWSLEDGVLDGCWRAGRAGWRTSSWAGAAVGLGLSCGFSGLGCAGAVCLVGLGACSQCLGIGQQCGGCQATRPDIPPPPPSLPSSPAPLPPLQDIGREFWEQQGKRERRERLVSVDGHAVLRMNLYDINQVQLTWAVLVRYTCGPWAAQAQQLCCGWDVGLAHALSVCTAAPCCLAARLANCAAPLQHSACSSASAGGALRV